MLVPYQKKYAIINHLRIDSPEKLIAHSSFLARNIKTDIIVSASPLLSRKAGYDLEGIAFWSLLRSSRKNWEMWAKHRQIIYNEGRAESAFTDISGQEFWLYDRWFYLPQYTEIPIVLGWLHLKT